MERLMSGAMRSALDTLPVGIVVADAGHRILYANPEAHRIAGHPFPPDALPVGRALRGETIENVEVTLRTERGRAVPILVSAAPLPDTIGAVTAAIAAFKDLADRHAAGVSELGTWDHDLITGEHRWSTQCKAMFGLPSDADVTDRTFLDALHPDDRPRVVAAIEHAIAGAGDYEVEFRVRRPDGRRSLLSRGRALFDEAGRAVRSTGIVIDITDARRTDEMFRLAVEAAPNAMVMVDEGGRILLVNACAERLFGYHRDELLGRSIEVLVPTRVRDSHRGERTAFHAHPHPRPMQGRELQAVAKDGREVPVEIGLNPIQTDTGTLVLAAMVDITERTRAREERQRLLEREQVARREAEEALEAFERLLTVTDGSASPPTLDEMFRELLTRLCTALQCDTATVLLTTPDGSHLTPAASVGLREEVDESLRIPVGQGVAGRIAATAAPVAIDDLATVDVTSEFLRTRVKSLAGVPLETAGRVIGVLHTGTVSARRFTVTDLELLKRVAKRATLAIERARFLQSERDARAAAEAANQAKDDFLAVLSHELRTPLMAMLGWVRLLRGGRLSAEQTRRGLEAIDRNTRLQARIVNDLLDVSRIVSGKLSLDERRVELGAVVGDAVESLAAEAHAKQIGVETILNPAAGAVWGDAGRLRQVIVNLLGNAIKFTPAGGHVRVALEPLPGRARVSVRDTGQGISPEFLPHIFERFRQEAGLTTRASGGLGLGLAIVQELVERHRGTIRAESEGPGRGATFIVELPVIAHHRRTEAVVQRPDASERQPDLRGVRLLVVEDHEDTRTVLQTTLEQCGALVHAAGSIAEALQALGGHEVDLVISDIAMPGGDGYELMRRLRRERGPDRALPAIALTAHASHADHEKIAAAGFDLHLRKPVDPTELAYAVQILCNAWRKAG